MPRLTYVACPGCHRWTFEEAKKSCHSCGYSTIVTTSALQNTAASLSPIASVRQLQTTPRTPAKADQDAAPPLKTEIVVGSPTSNNSVPNYFRMTFPERALREYPYEIRKFIRRSGAWRQETEMKFNVFLGSLLALRGMLLSLVMM